MRRGSHSKTGLAWQWQQLVQRGRSRWRYTGATYYWHASTALAPKNSSHEFRKHRFRVTAPGRSHPFGCSSTDRGTSPVAEARQALLFSKLRLRFMDRGPLYNNSILLLIAESLHLSVIVLGA